MSLEESRKGQEAELVEYTQWTLDYIRNGLDPMEFQEFLEIFRARNAAKAHVASR